MPAADDTVEIHYACLLAATGSCVDASRSKAFSTRAPYSVKLGTGQVVRGMEEGIRCLCLGALARLHVPPHMGYGPHHQGPIPPGSHLVFEVELLSVNGQRPPGPPRSPWLVRRLLMVPPPHEALASIRGPSALVRVHPSKSAKAIELAAEDERAFASSEPDREDEESQRAASSAATAAAAAARASAPLPSWLTRLRSGLPLPLPECTSYIAFAASMGSLLRDAARDVDLGPRLIPGASPIRHAPYATAWDSETPLVLTGTREGWPAREWGWDFWEKQHGHHFVLNKQRAPLFDEARSRAPRAERSRAPRSRARRRSPPLAPRSGPAATHPAPSPLGEAGPAKSRPAGAHG